jgi:hypothetical protein
MFLKVLIQNEFLFGKVLYTIPWEYQIILPLTERCPDPMQLCQPNAGFAALDGPEQLVRAKMYKSERGWHCGDCPFNGSVNRETIEN